MGPTNRILVEAKKIILKGKVVKLGTGTDRDMWEVAGVPVSREIDNEGNVKYWCTCRHHSIHRTDPLECSFITALKIYLVE